VEEFVKLADADDDAVLGFARRYGILGLCGRHNLPEAHNQFAGRALSEYNDTLPCNPTMREPVSEWRLWSRRFGACIQIAAAIQNEKPVDAEVFALLWQVQAPQGRIRNALARRQLEKTLNAYLLFGGCRPRVEVDKDIRLTFEPGGMFNLFGHLALRLVTTIARTEGLGLCSSCGVAYVVTGRRPRTDQRSYCDPCRADGAPQRDASRDSRRRKREAGR
jgi:hypothetical protein